MVLWLLLLALGLSSVSGRPRLPPLPMEGGCFVVSPELDVFRLEGEAVIVSFPMFHSVLKARRITLPSASPLITKTNGTNSSSLAGGRVLQRGPQLWLLPAQASDSGLYTIVYRNETFSVRGSLTLQVYSSLSVDMNKLSYPILASEGERLSFRCPSLSDFNQSHTLVQWHKFSGFPGLSPGPLFGSNGGRLLIPEVRRVHSGLYRCQLTVLLNQQQFRVSRVILLTVQENPQVTTTETDWSDPVTSDPGLKTSNSTTKQAPKTASPVIISPLNGTVFESSHGSHLELFCRVLTECPMAESTQVTWLVNGQSVESSFLDGRALQGGRRVSRVSEGCHIEIQLTILEMRVKDTEAELKCVTHNQQGQQEVSVRLQMEDSTSTWLMVAAVALSCSLIVVSVFIYVLLKPKRKHKLDYILARQNSTF